MTPELIKFLESIRDKKCQVTVNTLDTAFRSRGLVSVVDFDGATVHGLVRAEDVSGFRLTRRGEEKLHEALSGGGGAQMVHKYGALSNEVHNMLSSLRRIGRNCPKGIRFAVADDRLHILSEEVGGAVKNDEEHQLASIKLPFC